MQPDSYFIEVGIIADVVSQPQKTLTAIRQEGLTEDDFLDPVCRSAFKAIMESKSEDPIILTGLAMGAGMNEGFDLQSSNTRFDIANRITELVTEGRKRRLVDEVRGVILHPDRYTDTTAMSLQVGEIAKKHLESARSATIPPLTLSELPDPTPETDNPNALFRNGWLRKGGGVVLTAQSGVGKSVIVMQLAYAWSIGKPCFDIRPLRPLHIGIIQFEDDADEMSQFRDSMRKGYRLAGWTDEELATAESNIYWEQGAFLGVAGDAFISRLREVQRQRRYDLIIINPLQSCFGADISKNSAVSHFFREGIDPIIKDPENGCGVLFVHHTNKPPKTDDGKPAKDTDSPYEGAGGAEIVNWERAALVLKATKADGVFKLVAAKRGDRLAWRDDEGGKTKFKPIAHSEGIMFWRELDPEELPEELQPKTRSDPKEDAKELARFCLEQPRTATDVLKHSQDVFGNGRGRKVFYDVFKVMPSQYGVATMKDPVYSWVVYGTQEGCETLLKYLRNKRDGGADNAS